MADDTEVAFHAGKAEGLLEAAQRLRMVAGHLGPAAVPVIRELEREAQEQQAIATARDEPRRGGGGRHIHPCPACGGGAWCSNTSCLTRMRTLALRVTGDIREGIPARWCGPRDGTCDCRICRFQVRPARVHKMGSFETTLPGSCGDYAVNPLGDAQGGHKLRCEKHRGR
jgi:hypothetical protein